MSLVYHTDTTWGYLNLALAKLGEPDFEDLNRAALRGDLSGFEKLQRQMGFCERSDVLIKSAIVSGNIELIKWISARSEKADNLLYGLVFRVGCIDVVEWYLEKSGHEIDDCDFGMAVFAGNLEVVKWIWDKGFRPRHLRDFFLIHAAGSGPLELVKWLVEKDFPENPLVIKRAADFKQFETVKWLWERGYPCDKLALELIHENKDLEEISDWLKANPRD